MTSIEPRVRGPQELSRLTATAESADRMVEVTAGAFGDLRELRLDPRHRRTGDAAALAADIVATTRAAASSAARTAYDLVAARLPPGSTPEATDLIFGPALHALDRCTPTAAREDVSDSRPVIGEGLDRRKWRGRLLALRERVRVVTARADSDDGLITATVGGSGALLDLRLDPRVHRNSDSRRLADRITATVRDAEHRARARIAADLDDLLAGRNPRP